MNGTANKFFIPYLIFLAFAGGAAIFLASSRVGPGVSNDAAMMLSVANNVANGIGLIDFRGNELTQFPPVYPFLMATGHLLFGKDVVIAGWIINIFVFSAIIWFSGLSFYQIFYNEPILAYIGSFVIFSSTSIIKISSNIASDPLFMLIVIIILMSLSAYLITGQNRYLWLAGILTAIGCFQRYAGLSVVPVGGLVVIYKKRNEIGRAILSACFYVGAVAAPIFLWGYLHNSPINGTVFGSRIPYMPILNFVTGSEKLLNWFIPTQVILQVGPLPIYITLITLLAFLIIKTGAISDIRSTINFPMIIPHLFFLFIYIGVLIFNITPELQGLETDRAHIILLPSLIIILLTILGRILKVASDKLGKSRVYLALLLAIVIWSVYPVGKSYNYIQRSMLDGDVSSYNSLNKENIKDTSFSEFLSGLDTHNKQFYSNGEAAAWLILRVQVHSLPNSGSSHKPSPTFLEQHYKGWPGPGNDGYLIWFNSYASKEYLAVPEDLEAIANLNLVYSDEYGSVYTLTSR